MNYTVVFFEYYCKMPSLPRSVFQTHFVEHSNYKSKPIFDLHDDWIEGKNKNSAMFMQIFKSARLLIGGSYKCLYHTVMLWILPQIWELFFNKPAQLYPLF